MMSFLLLAARTRSGQLEAPTLGATPQAVQAQEGAPGETTTFEQMFTALGLAATRRDLLERAPALGEARVRHICEQAIDLALMEAEFEDDAPEAPPSPVGDLAEEDAAADRP